MVSPFGGGNAADQFFNSGAATIDYDHPNVYMGRSNLDHTNELSFGGGVNVKYGVNVSVIGHFYSAAPTTLTLDNTSGQAGEIFRTDVTGDGTTGDLLPGTLPGYYMHQVKGNSLNQTIKTYNDQMAGQPTPAGQSLIAAGLFTAQQLQQLGGVSAADRLRTDQTAQQLGFPGLRYECIVPDPAEPLPRGFEHRARCVDV